MKDVRYLQCHRLAERHMYIVAQTAQKSAQRLRPIAPIAIERAGVEHERVELSMRIERVV